MHTESVTVYGLTREIPVPDVGDFVTIESGPYGFEGATKGQAVAPGEVSKDGGVFVDIQSNPESDTATRYYLFPGEYVIDASGMYNNEES